MFMSLTGRYCNRGPSLVRRYVRRMFSSGVIPLESVPSLDDKAANDYDALVIVAPTIAQAPNFGDLHQELKAMSLVDKKADKGLFVLPSKLPINRVVFSGVGPLDKDYDDVRRYEVFLTCCLWEYFQVFACSYAEAAEKGVARAVAAGCKAPLLAVAPEDQSRFPKLLEVSLLGALKAAYVPLEVREAVAEKAKKIDRLALLQSELGSSQALDLVKALEAGKIVCRDIGGSDPERMAAPRYERSFTWSSYPLTHPRPPGLKSTSRSASKMLKTMSRLKLSKDNQLLKKSTPVWQLSIELPASFLVMMAASFG